MNKLRKALRKPMRHTCQDNVTKHPFGHWEYWTVEGLKEAQE